MEIVIFILLSTFFAILLYSKQMRLPNESVENAKRALPVALQLYDDMNRLGKEFKAHPLRKRDARVSISRYSYGFDITMFLDLSGSDSCADAIAIVEEIEEKWGKFEDNLMLPTILFQRYIYLDKKHYAPTIEARIYLNMEESASCKEVVVESKVVTSIVETKE